MQMTVRPPDVRANSREQLVHTLYEAAELEHNLMCTYLYAAYSLRDPDEPGLGAAEAGALRRWRSAILNVAIEEMGHLVSVWNITTALGAAPRIGRTNFPLDPGYLPANVVVRLAPFDAATLQHFIYLERPVGSTEPDGDGFACEREFVRGGQGARLTPMATDYATVGEFYQTLKDSLCAFVGKVGESVAFDGNAALQIAGAEFGLPQARPVVCLKTALAAFDAIVAQGEGSPADSASSHYQSFVAIRSELEALAREHPEFRPAHPAATNPVLRRPPRPEGRVWIEDPQAAATVDLANACYGLMLRLLAYAYSLPRTDAAKSAAIGLGIGLMRTIAPLAEHAARLPAGPSNPACHAGISFTTLRDTAALPAGDSAANFFRERLNEFAEAAARLAAGATGSPPRLADAAAKLHALAARAGTAFGAGGARATAAPAPPAAAVAAPGNPAPGEEVVAGRDIEIHYRAERCIHSRFCVTGAPKVFLANVQGPWIHPDAMPVERLAEIAHACPSGAIRYRRLDARPAEPVPPVNLASVREAGPYAFRGDLRLDGEPVGYRATLCRCGASRHKPYCDGSHHEIGFGASGEPPTGSAEMLAVRDGPLAIEPQSNGPLEVSGNLEITSGTGRVVARLTSARLCRCGGSQNKPFCDGTHAKIGFRS
jgi:CDGSH-type Zn-finger protein/uncharacterized Fe-S cluster protein YjdI